jgi:hypothetical protein
MKMIFSYCSMTRMAVIVFLICEMRFRFAGNVKYGIK